MRACPFKTLPTIRLDFEVLHLEYLKERHGDKTRFLTRAAGQYYTGEEVGRRLAREVAEAFHIAHSATSAIKVVDPFLGDGRLIGWLIEAWYEAGFPDVRWQVDGWDISDAGFDRANADLRRLAADLQIKLRTKFSVGDAFATALKKRGCFDIVVTNPPWELLKPDRRELKSLAPASREQYVARMRTYDQWLTQNYPRSQPKRKFAGWGTNLSRVGLDASLAIVRVGGVAGVVMPASFLADDQTSKLREAVLTSHCLHSVCYYPAESKLYGGADVASIAIAMEVGARPAASVAIANFKPATRTFDEARIELDHGALRGVDYVMPVSFGANALSILNRLAQQFPSWRHLESTCPGALWAGREIDETGVTECLGPPRKHAPLFVKGRMIGRYETVEEPSQALIKSGWTPPSSSRFRRIGWRDVSRPSQKRRMIATLIEPGWVAGNSLGVAFFRDLAEAPLLSLLGVMNSLAFEFQLRAHLATGHVSLSSLRKVAVPSMATLKGDRRLPKLVAAALHSGDSSAFAVDAYVAKVMYGLTLSEYETIISAFDLLTKSERKLYVTHYQKCRHLPAAAPSPDHVAEEALEYFAA